MRHHESFFSNHSISIQDQVEVERPCRECLWSFSPEELFDFEQAIQQRTRGHIRAANNGAVQVVWLGRRDTNWPCFDERGADDLVKTAFKLPNCGIEMRVAIAKIAAERYCHANSLTH